ncbi:putative quinol monooxygenase [Streptomyces sp. CA-111067]|uniref:putative quinol monooxygenase n=1 Tax=Streptomyces sp. CA-111067 TaxID=3240046 RepID=UPI003D951613
MTVKYGLLVQLEAQAGKADELAAFLEQGQALAEAEPDTVTWYAFRIDEQRFGIFDTFESEDGRQAHLSGPIAAALGEVAGTLLAKAPDIQPIGLIAAK